MDMNKHSKMVKVLIYIRGDHSIEEYCFFSRELSPVMMDYKEVGLTLVYNTQTKHTHLCLIKLVPNSGIFNHHSSKADNQTPSFQLTFTDIVPVKEAKLLLDAHVVSCISCELKRSKAFRRRFLKYIAKTEGFVDFIVPNSVTVSDVSEFFDSVVLVPYVVILWLQYPKQKLDYPWDYRIQGLVNKRTVLDDAMNWLSTLGGGYSSLGDYYQHHAEEAGRISIQQLKLAQDMGDPIVASRCKLFFAQSLMQLGYIRQSKQIVRTQGHFIKSLLVPDDKLTALYKSLRFRLRQIQSSQKTVVPETNLQLTTAEQTGNSQLITLEQTTNSQLTTQEQTANSQLTTIETCSSRIVFVSNSQQSGNSQLNSNETSRCCVVSMSNLPPAQNEKSSIKSSS